MEDHLDGKGNFGEYFIKQDNKEKKENINDSINYLNKKYNIGEKESKQTSLDNIIYQHLSGKDMNKFQRRNSRFPSSKEINKELRQSLKDEGVLKKSEEEENLIIRKMTSISEQNFIEKVINKIAKGEVINKLSAHLKTVSCNFKTSFSNSSLGGISPLTFLIESFYKADLGKEKEIKDKYNLLKPYIYNFRTINGDGNCFYRATIFRYLEILVLNKKVDILRNVIYDVMQSFQSEELNKRRIILNSDIKPDLTLKILILILDLLNKNLIQEAHQTLVKCFCTCRKFDYCLIFYLRYILYKYIKENENKIYLKSFPIKIGNLLPSQYENQKGEFLFNSFYENYLLKFYTDAEKIIIYLTPFVLGIELNIIVFDLDQQDVLQKFIYEGNSDIKTGDVISLLNNRNHYEIVYTEKDNEKYKNYFYFYENRIQSQIINKNTKFPSTKKNYDIDEKQNDYKPVSFSNLKVSEINENENETETKILLKKEYINNIKNNNNQNYTNLKDNNIENHNNNQNNENKRFLGNNNPISNKNNIINCRKCQKEIQLNNLDNLCEKCIKQKIFNVYLDSIQKDENPIKYLFDENKFNLDKIIPIYNANFKDKLDKNTIIKHINDKICIFKEECSNKSQKKLPCQCELCEHFIEYFKHFNFKKHFKCSCLTPYSRKKMFKLGTIFLNISEDISKNLAKYFEERTSFYCCIRKEKLLSNEKANGFYFQSSENDMLNLDPKNINKFLSLIKHYVCQRCLNNMPKNFTCEICEISHYIKKKDNK